MNGGIDFTSTSSVSVQSFISLCFILYLFLYLIFYFILINSKLITYNNNNNIIKFVGIFYMMRYKLNLEISKMIYYAFVHSHLIYGVEMYGNTY